MKKFHKARKDHQCDLCGRKIPSGTKYWRDYEEDSNGMSIADHKEHANCELYSRKDKLPDGWRHGK